MTWNLDIFQDKDVVFVGKGKGRSYEGFKAFLLKHGKARTIDAVDKKQNTSPLAFLSEYVLSDTIFVKNEGIPGREMPVPYVTPMQLFFSLAHQTKAKIIGITGTKGKSTTTALTAHILKNAGKDVVLAGNIGISPLEMLDTAGENTIFVLELSSYQLSDLDKSPHISACLNLYNDHTDWHGSLEAYWEAKHSIMKFSSSNDLFIYNPGFKELIEWAKAALCRTKAIDTAEVLRLDKAKLFGEHNRLNALVAREIARELSIDDSVTQAAIESFEPLQHRMQYVADRNNKIYIDDAIGMTPESTLASLTAVTEKYGKVGCLLLGGQDRDYDFKTLMEKIAELKIPYLVLFPDTVKKMQESLPKGYEPHIHESSQMAEAVRYADEHAPSKSVVLLSTAAPSYSLWRDFEDKGDQFQAAVNSL